MIKILFICRGNSCRSQMAEGWCDHFHKGKVAAFSGGIVPCVEVNRHAVAVMKEKGIDISEHRSKHVSEFKEVRFDLVVTLCSNAEESLPFNWNGAKKIYREFKDPLVLSENSKTEEEILGHYRRIRDELEEFVKKLPMALTA